MATSQVTAEFTRAGIWRLLITEKKRSGFEVINLQEDMIASCITLTLWQRAK